MTKLPIIAIAGNQPTTLDVLDALLREGYKIDYLINVGPDKSSTIAWYIDMSLIAREKGISVIRPATYSMKDEVTKDIFRPLNIDILISIGWKRLFPKWFLDSLSIGAFGMHGSSEKLPRGRGRSPMNWSIIENRDRFYTSLFKYDEGVDSGVIVGTQRFDIRPWDTIQSLQHKNAVSQQMLLIKYLPDIIININNLFIFLNLVLCQIRLKKVDSIDSF